MASVTRSNRRAEGPHHNHHHRGPYHHNTSGGGPLTRSGPTTLLHQAHTGGAGGRRTKRGLDTSDHDFEALKSKKARITVEILAKPSPNHRDHAALLQKQHHPMARPATTVTAPAVPRQPAAPNKPPPQQKPKTNTVQDSNTTKSHEKAVNGIKHELNKLQPQASSTREPGRKLRSQEATRFKSELSAYFPEYDEVIGNDPKEQHILNLETPVVVVDSHPKRVAGAAHRGSSAARPRHQNPHSYCENYPVRGYSDALFTTVFDAQRIDFSFLEVQYKNSTLEDPLPDSVFEPAHKRAERLERSIRNSEKGRAQHEKDQIIRLLEGLQGHDWLRVMGVSGITETKKKSFEPAREHFIKGCRVILEKFRTWNLEEKRRKLKKDKELAEQAIKREEEEKEEEEDEEEEDDEEDEEEDEAQAETSSGNDKESDEEEVEDSEELEDDLQEADAASQATTSDASSPAKQLLEEALARSKLAKQATRGSQRSRSTAEPTPDAQPDPTKEFSSFFSKRHEREGALSHHRRTGRKALAWGHPIPDLPEAEFVLPDAYRDEEMMKSRARKKRRDKRHKS